MHRQHLLVLDQRLDRRERRRQGDIGDRAGRMEQRRHRQADHLQRGADRAAGVFALQLVELPLPRHNLEQSACAPAGSR
jgi:hypothetical protein